MPLSTYTIALVVIVATGEVDNLAAVVVPEYLGSLGIRDNSLGILLEVVMVLFWLEPLFSRLYMSFFPIIMNS